jgi:hypothetical protein
VETGQPHEVLAAQLINEGIEFARRGGAFAAPAGGGDEKIQPVGFPIRACDAAPGR